MREISVIQQDLDAADAAVSAWKTRQKALREELTDAKRAQYASDMERWREQREAKEARYQAQQERWREQREAKEARRAQHEANMARWRQEREEREQARRNNPRRLLREAQARQAQAWNAMQDLTRGTPEWDDAYAAWQACERETIACFELVGRG